MNTDLDKELQELGDRLQAEYATTEVPSARRERAMFVEGAAQRSRPRIRIMVPALATTALLVVVFFTGRATSPQDPLYEVFSAVGLADTTLEDIDALIEEADHDLDRGESLVERDEAHAVGLASDALMELGHAQALLDQVSQSDATDRQTAIDKLRARALALLLSAHDSDDNSGPGSGDEDPEDDSSGPGSGDDSDDSDDSSGPGSGDDSDDSDDSSGPGSGDDSDDSDNSGSGSGDDSDDSDNSGPGSVNSGSGSNDDREDYLDDLEDAAEDAEKD